MANAATTEVMGVVSVLELPLPNLNTGLSGTGAAMTETETFQTSARAGSVANGTAERTRAWGERKYTVRYSVRNVSDPAAALEVVGECALTQEIPSAL